jgi:hypothetical protein
MIRDSITGRSKIQGDSGGKGNILEGDRIGNCEEKKFIYTCV